jgi:DNA-binding Lrp family transcriptional regulator
LDKVDSEILKILCKDARVPFKRIAAELGIATETVVRRFKKLQEDGVVLGSTVVLSSEALGFKELVGFLLKTRSGTNISTIYNELINVPKIILVVQEWGVYDFYIEAFLRDLSEMHDVLDSLRRIEGIAAIAPMVYKQQDWTIPYMVPLPALCRWLSQKASGKT